MRVRELLQKLPPTDACPLIAWNVFGWGTAEGLVYTPIPAPKPLETAVPLIKALKSSNEAIEVDKPLRFKELSTLNLELGTVTFPAEGMKYQYRVFPKETPTDEVHDLKWIDLENSNLIISDLSGGNYNLQIRAQKEGGSKWSDSQTYLLEAVKRWYRSWWGILLLGLTGFLFFWYALRQWSLKRIKRLHKNLKEQQRELSAKQAELQSSDDTIAVIYQIINEVSEQTDLSTTRYHIETHCKQGFPILMVLK